MKNRFDFEDILKQTGRLFWPQLCIIARYTKQDFYETQGNVIGDGGGDDRVAHRSGAGC